MKRRNHARLVGVGRDAPDVVDKTKTPGRVFTNKELIDQQLRGVPLRYGEMYGKRLKEDGTTLAPHPTRRQRGETPC